MADRSIDEKDCAMFQLGFNSALRMVERLARRDCRVELAKKCGHVPGWQKGRWSVADEVANHLSQQILREE